MKKLSPQFLILVTACVTLAGCRTSPNDRCERAIALLRAEKIDLEDRYYQLESRYESLLDKTGQVDEGFVPRQFQGYSYPVDGMPYQYIDSNPAPGIAPLESYETLPSPPAESDGESVIQPGSMNNSGYSATRDQIPEIIIDTGEFSVLDRNHVAQPSSPTMNFPAPNLRHPANAPQQWQNSSQAAPTPDNLTPTQSLPEKELALPEKELASYITDLVINCDLTNAREDASWLIVQPVDSDRSAIPVPGELTVSLIDPRQAGSNQRVGIWNFKTTRVATWIRDREGTIPGIHVPLPASLKHRNLNGNVLFVRYTGLDGQQFETSHELDADLQVAVTQETRTDDSQNGVSNSEADQDTGWRPYR